MVVIVIVVVVKVKVKAKIRSKYKLDYLFILKLYNNLNSRFAFLAASGLRSAKANVRRKQMFVFGEYELRKLQQ